MGAKAEVLAKGAGLYILAGDGAVIMKMLSGEKIYKQ